MLGRCSLYLSHPGMFLRQFFKGLGRLAHLLIEKAQVGGVAQKQFQQPPLWEFCAQSCRREKPNVQRVISIPVSGKRLPLT